MTVKELIEKLKQYPEDMEICTLNQSKDETIKNIWEGKVYPGVDIVEKKVLDEMIAARPCKETAGAERKLVLS